MAREELVALKSLELHVAKACGSESQQSAIAAYFKAPSFFLTHSGLRTGTNVSTGKREIYCTVESARAVYEHLEGRLGTPLEPLPPHGPEAVQGVNAVQVQDPAGIKALYKELQKHNKQVKAALQLSDAQRIYQQAVRWTQPLAPRHARTEAGLPAAHGPEAAAAEGRAGTHALAPAEAEAAAVGTTGLSLVPAAAEPAGTPSLATCNSCATSVSTKFDGGAQRVVAIAAAACQHVAVQPRARDAAGAVVLAPAEALADHDATTAPPPEEKRCAASHDRSQPVSRCSSSTSLSAQQQGEAGAGGADGPSAAAADDDEALTVFCSIDFEWWEQDSSKVTEVGWTLWDNFSRELVARHWIVKENESLNNTVHVPNHKYFFRFGTSQVGSLQEAAQALQADIDGHGTALLAAMQHQYQHHSQHAHEAHDPQQQLDSAVAPAAASPDSSSSGNSGAAGDGPGAGAGAVAGAAWPRCCAAPVRLVLVGHGMSQDVKMLKGQLGVRLPADFRTLDTVVLTWARTGGLGPNREKAQVSLRVLLQLLQIPDCARLHNGGNDALYTMQALLALCGQEVGVRPAARTTEPEPV